MTVATVPSAEDIEKALKRQNFNELQDTLKRLALSDTNRVADIHTVATAIERQENVHPDDARQVISGKDGALTQALLYSNSTANFRALARHAAPPEIVDILSDNTDAYLLTTSNNIAPNLFDKVAVLCDRLSPNAIGDAVAGAAPKAHKDVFPIILEKANDPEKLRQAIIKFSDGRTAVELDDHARTNLAHLFKKYPPDKETLFSALQNAVESICSSRTDFIPHWAAADIKNKFEILLNEADRYPGILDKLGEHGNTLAMRIVHSNADGDKASLMTLLLMQHGAHIATGTRGCEISAALKGKGVLETPVMKAVIIEEELHKTRETAKHMVEQMDVRPSELTFENYKIIVDQAIQNCKKMRIERSSYDQDKIIRNERGQKMAAPSTPIDYPSSHHLHMVEALEKGIGDNHSIPDTMREDIVEYAEAAFRRSLSRYGTAQSVSNPDAYKNRDVIPPGRF